MLSWVADRDLVIAGVCSDFANYQVYVDPSVNSFGPSVLDAVADNFIVITANANFVQLNHPVLKGTAIFVQATGGTNVSLFVDDTAVLPAEV